MFLLWWYKAGFHSHDTSLGTDMNKVFLLAYNISITYINLMWCLLYLDIIIAKKRYCVRCFCKYLPTECDNGSSKELTTARTTSTSIINTVTSYISAYLANFLNVILHLYVFWLIYNSTIISHESLHTIALIDVCIHTTRHSLRTYIVHFTLFLFVWHSTKNWNSKLDKHQHAYENVSNMEFVCV